MINFDMIGRDEMASPQTNGSSKSPKMTNRLNPIGACSIRLPDYNRVVHEENARTSLVLDDRFDHESALNVFFRSYLAPFQRHDARVRFHRHPTIITVTDTAEKIDYAR